jgi:hypothetical protein
MFGCSIYLVNRAFFRNRCHVFCSASGWLLIGNVPGGRCAGVELPTLHVAMPVVIVRQPIAIKPVNTFVASLLDTFPNAPLMFRPT